MRRGPVREGGLGCYVAAEVGFGHGGGWVVGHGGLAVQAVDGAGLGGEVVAEDGVAAQFGLGGEDRYGGGAEEGAAYLECAADAAERW